MIGQGLTYTCSTSSNGLYQSKGVVLVTNPQYKWLLYLLLLPDPVVLPGLQLAEERWCRDPARLSFPLLDSWPLFMSTSSCVCSPPLSSYPGELSPPLAPGSGPPLVRSACPVRTQEPGEGLSSSPSGKPSPPGIPCCEFSSDRCPPLLKLGSRVEMLRCFCPHQQWWSIEKSMTTMTMFYEDNWWIM